MDGFLALEPVVSIVPSPAADVGGLQRYRPPTSAAREGTMDTTGSSARKSSIDKIQARLDNRYRSGKQKYSNETAVYKKFKTRIDF
jgi:hypothetical protein